MRGGQRLGAARWILGSLTLILASSASSARAAFEPGDESWEGTSELVALARRQLGEDRIHTAQTLDWRTLGPADGVLVLHPLEELDFVEVSRFLRQGGRLALLDDHGRGSALLERFRIRRVPPPARPQRSLRDNPALALAVPSTQQVAGHEQGRHAIVGGVTRLITNHPMGLEHPDLTPVLSIPTVDEPPVTLAVTGIIADRGRLFAMGDPSVVINLMLRFPGNRAFASGLLDYLVEDDSWGERGGHVHLVVNEFEQHRAHGGPAGLWRDLGGRVDQLRETLDRTQRLGLHGSAAHLLGLLAALGAAAWALSATTRPFRRSLPGYARLPSPIAQGGAAGRVALLAAPSTHRALTLLELGSALQERLGLALGLTPPLSWTEILHEIDRQKLLRQPSSERLRRLVEEIRSLEASVAASRPTRATARTVHRMRDSVNALLQELAPPAGGGP